MTVLGTVSDNSNWNELYLQAMDFLGGASTNLNSTRKTEIDKEFRKMSRMAEGTFSSRSLAVNFHDK